MSQRPPHRILFITTGGRTNPGDPEFVLKNPIEISDLFTLSLSNLHFEFGYFSPTHDEINRNLEQNKQYLSMEMNSELYCKYNPLTKTHESIPIPNQEITNALNSLLYYECMTFV